MAEGRYDLTRTAGPQQLCNDNALQGMPSETAGKYADLPGISQPLPVGHVAASKCPAKLCPEGQNNHATSLPTDLMQASLACLQNIAVLAVPREAGPCKTNKPQPAMSLLLGTEILGKKYTPVRDEAWRGGGMQDAICILHIPRGCS